MTVDRYFVLGNPVAHSHSPFIHAAFAQQTGQAMHYDRCLCALDCFAETLNRLRSDNEGGPVRGCNVTVPFKQEAYRLATAVTERARRAGAANVLSFAGGQSQADNTDGAGLVRDLQQHAGWSLHRQRVLLIGAGGAAAGVLGPLLECQLAQIVVANRTVDKAQALTASHQDLARAQGCALEAAGLDSPGQAFDIVLNASASSLAGTGVPVPDSVLRPGSLVVDLMYGPAALAFLNWAQHHGAHARDGLGMLVEQAAEAFFIWRGVRPDTAPVLQALRQRLGASP